MRRNKFYEEFYYRFGYTVFYNLSDKGEYVYEFLLLISLKFGIQLLYTTYNSVILNTEGSPLKIHRENQVQILQYKLLIPLLFIDVYQTSGKAKTKSSSPNPDFM